MYKILAIFIFIVIIDIFLSIYRNYRRKKTFNNAYIMSRKLKKKLLIIGSPTSGFWNKHIESSYGCGDICIDLKGCGNCNNQIVGDLLTNLKNIQSNKYVIFESCVLEYIDDNLLPETIDEIMRVSNGNYYSVRIAPNIFNTSFSITQYGF